MNRIVIITFTDAWNYGAFYQAKGLYTKLSSHGEVVFLRYANEKLNRDYRTVRFSFSIKGIARFLTDLLMFKTRLRLKKLFYEAWSEFSYIERDEIRPSDILFSGSDQIWNPNLADANSKINGDYFWKDFSNVKLAYSSSSGSYVFNSKEQIQLKAMLKDYTFIGLREPHLKNILKLSTAKIVCDPSLFMDIKLEKNPNREQGYILVYTVPRSSVLRKTITHFKKLGKRIVLVDRSIVPLVSGLEIERSPSVYELLNLFLHADSIITDSFHGTCMSLKFNKPFLVCNPQGNQNRIENILEVCNLRNRYISDDSMISNELNGVLDVQLDSKEELSEFVTRSTNYLNEALLEIKL